VEDRGTIPHAVYGARSIRAGWPPGYNLMSYFLAAGAGAALTGAAATTGLMAPFELM
jgi:hypothetical protein